MRKISFEVVKSNFEKQNYELLEDTYINNRAKMKCKCRVCGYINYVKYNSVQLGQGCPKCAIENNANRKRHPFDKVKDMFDSWNYTLLETKYINANTKMKYICNTCGTESSARYADLQQGHGCMHCASLKTGQKLAYTFDEVKRVFDNRGYILLETEYKSWVMPMRYICPNHGEQMIKFRGLVMGHGCAACFYENNRGEGNARWLGGVKELKDYLRSNTVEWKKQSLEHGGYKCFLTGEKSGELEIHHKFSFSTIVYDTMKELELPIHQTIGEYTPEELSLITTTFIKNHNAYGYGVVLLLDIHILFHQLYSYYNNTPEQFEEFKHRYLSGEFTIAS